MTADHEDRKMKQHKMIFEVHLNQLRVLLNIEKSIRPISVSVHRPCCVPVLALTRSNLNPWASSGLVFWKQNRT